MTDAPPRLAFRDLGRVPYAGAHALQEQLVEQRAQGEIDDLLLVCEHDAVITAGRATGDDFLRDDRFDVVQVERGGQATYHGPGQIVIYPIVMLAPGARDLHAWLRALEQGCLDALLPLGLNASRREGATGVWLDADRGTAGGRQSGSAGRAGTESVETGHARKLVSLGVAARRWVTWHGLALNHETDLSHFDAIVPCGFDANVMTSLRRELGVACPTRESLVTDLVAALGARLAPFRTLDP